MPEYTILDNKSVQKKLKLKNYTLELVKNMKKVDLDTLYADNYISDNGNTKADYAALIKRVESCGTNTTYHTLNTANKTTGEITSKTKTIDTQSCHVYSLCPVCASAKRAEILSSLRPYMDVLIPLKNDKKIFLYTGTITIEDTANPSADYDNLRDAWTRFNKLGQSRKNGKNSFGEAAKIIGSLLSIEIVPKEDGKFHVHGHLLFVNTEKFDFTVYDPEEKKKLEKIYGYGNIPKEELVKIETIDGMSKLSKEWYSVSGAKNIWVRPLNEMVKNRDGKKIRIPIEKQIMELVKYSTKPWEISPKKTFDIFDALCNKKRITKSGIFTKNKRYNQIFDALLDNNNLLEKFTFLKNKNDNTLNNNSDDEIEEEIEILKSEIVTLQMEKVEFMSMGHLFAKDFLDSNNKKFADCKNGHQTTGAHIIETPLYVILKQTPEYKKFMAARMVFVNEYRTKYNDLKKTLPLVRRGLLTPEKWIKDKKNLKKELIEKMQKHDLEKIKYLKIEPEKIAA